MSKAAALYSSLIGEFPESMQSISKLSRNDDGKKDFIRADATAFNFDTLFNDACHPPCKEKSPDALFLHEDTLYFVEFKEGSADRSDVRQKIHEGVLTLFQYGTSRGILNRTEFLEMNIKYAVVKRNTASGSNSFLETLEQSQDIFRLKNIQGLLISEAVVKWNPQTIYKMLKKISGGKLEKMEVISTDQSSSIAFQ